MLRTRVPALAVGIVAVPLLSSCPAPYTSLSRKAEASSVPDMYCLIDRFREITPARSVTYTVEDIGNVTRYTFVYVLPRDILSLTFFARPNRPVIVEHLGGVDDDHAERLPEIRAKLLHVEEQLTGRCGLVDMMAGAVEECRGQGCTKR